MSDAWPGVGIESVPFICRPELGSGKPVIPLFQGLESFLANWKVEDLEGDDVLLGLARPVQARL